jgi:hypothetical protein
MGKVKTPFNCNVPIIIIIQFNSSLFFIIIIIIIIIQFFIIYVPSQQLQGQLDSTAIFELIIIIIDQNHLLI